MAVSLRQDPFSDPDESVTPPAAVVKADSASCERAAEADSDDADEYKTNTSSITTLADRIG